MATQKKDPGNIIRAIYDEGSNSVQAILTGGNLVPDQYDQISLTYITSGNGTGEIGTATYKLNNVSIATLTLTYDSSNRLIDVVRS